jgi:hypothetical protein
MDIGLSIFLSVILISIIYLGQKLSKPIWLKIIKILGLSILGTPFIIWLCIIGYNKYENYPLKITEMTEYGGIKLGDTDEQVRFLKGDPIDQFSKRYEKYQIDRKKVPISITKTSDLGIFWQYELIEVEFTKDKIVKGINCFCIKDCYVYSCPTVFSIAIGSSYSDIVNVLGNPPFHKNNEYGNRFLKYPQYNIYFSLRKNEVYNLGIYKNE